MLSLLAIVQANLPVYLLIFARISAAIVLIPVFGSRNVPYSVKAAISFILTLIVGLTLQISPLTVPTDMIAYFLTVLGEVLIGLTIGFITLIFFAAVQIAGELIGLQMGFGVVNILDPQLNASISIISQFQFILATLIFLVINGHHRVIEALVMSYNVLPFLGLGAIQPAGWEIMRLGSLMFLLAMQVGAPVILALFLSDLAFGIIAQTVPQMNIFIVGFPVKIFVGFVFLIATLSFFGNFLVNLFDQMFDSIETILLLMR